MSSRYTRCATLMLCLVTAVPSALAQDAFASAREVYDKTLIKISTQHAQKLRAYPASYVAALKRAERSLRHTGDLDGFQAVQKELVRFEGEGVLRREHVHASCEPLRRIQEQHLASRAAYDAEKSRDVLKLRDQYIAHLEALQVRQTDSGSLEQAIVTRDEIRRVNASEIVAEARAMAAAEEASRKPTVVDGVTIYPAGTRPAQQRGVVYRSRSLSRTQRSPLSGGVSVQSWIGAKRDTDIEGGGRSSSDSQHLRLALRTRRAGSTKNDLRVVVQYFAKSFSTEAVRMKTGAEEVEQRMVAVQRLEATPVYLDFQAVTFSARSGESSRSGDKFHGIGVSVFTGAGELLYQGTTVRNLDAVLVTALPEEPERRRRR